VIKEGARVRFYSRSGAEYTERLPRMVDAFTDLPTRSVVLDGELCTKMALISVTYR
jgi:ATP-dependent DNA ligase